MSSGSYGEVPGLERVELSPRAAALLCSLGLFVLVIWSMAVVGVLCLLGVF